MSHLKQGTSHRFESGIDIASWITLRWVRGTRYYRVHLEQDFPLSMVQ